MTLDADWNNFANAIQQKLNDGLTVEDVAIFNRQDSACIGSSVGKEITDASTRIRVDASGELPIPSLVETWIYDGRKYNPMIFEKASYFFSEIRDGDESNLYVRVCDSVIVCVRTTDSKAQAVSKIDDVLKQMNLLEA